MAVGALAGSAVSAGASVAASLAWSGGAAASTIVDRRIQDRLITESSGLAPSGRVPGVLWTINDSGHRPVLYGIGPDGATVARLVVSGVRNTDWEALAAGRGEKGRPVLWVGDIGDNGGSRRQVLVHRVVEPAELKDARVQPQSFRLAFPGGPRNAEAMMVDPRTQRLYLVSKAATGAKVYAAPERLDSQKVNRLTPVATAPPTVTDAAFLPDGRIVMRNYQRGFLLTGLGATPTPFRLPRQEAGESLAVTPDGVAVLVGQEGADRSISRVSLPATAQPSSAAPAPPVASVKPSSRPAVPVEQEGVFARAKTVAIMVLSAILALLFSREAMSGRRRGPPATSAVGDDGLVQSPGKELGTGVGAHDDGVAVGDGADRGGLGEARAVDREPDE
jgi:hypothetical protein